MEEVAEVYSSYISPKYDQRALQKLETDGALERTFWPSVSSEMSAEHVWVIVCLVNEKMREGTNPLLFLTAVDSEGQDASKFEVFFARLVDIAFDEAGVFANPEAAASRHQATAELRLHYASFLVHVYQCLESATVRRCCIGQCLSLSMWRALSDQRLAAEIKATPALQQRWDELPPVTAPTQSSSGATAPSATPPSKQKGGKKRKAAEEATHTSSTATVTAGPMEQFFPTLANYFLSSLARAVGDSSAGGSGDGFTFVLQFLQKFCELVVDLLSQLPTRRFLRTVLDDMHFVTFARLLLTAQKGCGGRAESEFKVLKEMLDRIESLMHFEIDDLTGRALSSLDMVARNNARLTAFQQSLFAAYGAAVRQVYFSSLGQLGRRDVLTKHCNELLSVQQLVHVTGGLALFDAGRDVNTLLRLLESSGSVSADGEEEAGDIEGEAATTLSVSSSQTIKLSAKQATQLKTLLIDVLCDYLVLRESQLDAVNRLPLYPSEELLWDLSQLPVVSKPSKSSTSGSSASESSSSSNQFLTLPKLNLQFLTTYDYLLRNFELFRLESAYEIRADIMDAVRRMLPKRGSRPGQAAVFSGWSRMAMQPISVGIDEVSKPQLGQLVPGRVTASVEVDLSKLSRDIRSEWESLREHDVVFLVCISDPQPLPSTTAKSGSSSSSNVAAYADEEEETRAFRAQYGVRYVRGGQIFEVRDGEDGTILNDPARQMDSEQGTQHEPSSRRKFRLHMDTAQYYNDMKAGVEECYTETNLVVRRHSKENNFKPVLETIRDLMNCPAMGGAAMVPGTTVNQAGGGGRAKESDPECFHDVPAWLHEVFLGYGAPDSAHYRSLAKKKALALAGKAVGSSKTPPSAAAGVVTATAAAPSESLAYADTFLDAAHAVEAFTTGAEVEPTAEVYFAVGDDFSASAAAKKTNLSTLQMASGPNVKALQVDRSVSPAVLSALPPPPYRVTVWHGAATAPATSAGKEPEAAAVATPTSPATPASAGKKGAKATASASKKRGGKAAATAAEPTEAAAAPMATEESASASATPAAKTATKKRGARRDIVLISAYPDRCPGPYPTEEPPRNAIRFTPAQVEAIRSGMNPGLTMVVGPPGTGKTDTAVQLISNLYHNFPQHRILLITHSNAALNDLFAKIMERNVEARHLLRLGAGEAELRETLQAAAAAARVGGGQGNDEVFSKHGRVQWCLARRLALLEEVQRLGLCFSTTTSSGVSSDVGDVGYTCETAGYFYQYHVRTRIAEFETKLKALEGKIGSKACSETVADIFPFSAFFANAPKQPLFGSSADKQEQFRADREVAVGCIRHIHKVFNELADYRPLELLRSQGHRCDYMLMKQARVVAMTCTHAAMTRRKLMALGFRFDTVVMEESAQILEVETLIPMLLQRYNTSDGDNSGGGRLQRVTLIGDHHQLPPVIKNQAIQSYSHLDQSLFSRFIRLGVPHVLLDQQGRARPEIASLYSWRYTRHSPATGALVQQLSNLSIVQGSDGQSSYARANAGFLHPFQLVDVGDFQGKGETAPTPYFYQNLGEAEYIVAVYQYMRLLGYPASSISVLTTYNGQKSLIRDVMRQRCANNATFGMPAAISTVDQYQGQQNDYVLLSLVRTRHVGHLRDVRRLVVAMSRARLGLYVFCRKALFSKCIELQPVFRQLVSEHADASETGASGRKAGAKKGAKVTAGAAADVSPGNQLMLVSGEAYPSQRPVHFPASDLSAETLHCVQDATAMGVLVYQMVQLAQHQYNEQQLQKMHAAAAAAPMQTGDGDESDDPEDGFEEASDGEDAEAQ